MLFTVSINFLTFFNIIILVSKRKSPRSSTSKIFLQIASKLLAAVSIFVVGCGDGDSDDYEIVTLNFPLPLPFFSQ